ncbi:putative ubiquitin carboxyl-terminal hydrolase creB [Tirmania nivea]|nr:putative ubiquitin carboxyl-terminal hydrolase creB [Tirmania nivea]
MNLFKWRGGSGNNNSQSSSPQAAKTNSTPFVRGIAELVDDGPPRLDGSDKFFGMENKPPAYTLMSSYCNSILQCLYFSKPFRDCVVNYPQRSMLSSGDIIQSTARSAKSPLSPTSPKDEKRKSIPMITAVHQVSPLGKVEDPNSPEAKKKVALTTGPLLKVDAGNYGSYGMEESLFSALKDLFETILAHTSRTGVISPLRFVEILKRENEMFRSSVHQDAHEFLNYVLNQVIENVEFYQKKLLSIAKANGTATQPSQLLTVKPQGAATPVPDSSAASTVSGATSSAIAMSNLSAGWIHDLFEGLLTSETKCLTCETISRRDEVFLDLSIDLDKHTSVTSCLNNFSASEMLCERNKFHCDCCGGLQEAEKRMKIKRLPRILALHLKRFKYSEEIGRHQKLFHRVVYPYYLRLFNTTDDAEDPDRLYELYAVVVHIGGGPYHGHYVTIVKTEDKGWLLFDDELVEPVDKNYVRNFFGDEKKLACAYVLFYQETTFEKMQKEMNEEPAGKAHATASVALDEVPPLDSTMLKEKAGLNGDITDPQVVEVDDDNREKAPLTHSLTTPLPVGHEGYALGRTPAEIAAEHQVPHKSKKERERERKEEKAAEKAAAKLAAKNATHEEPAAAELSKEGREKEKEKEKEKGFRRGHSWFGGSGTNGKDKEKREQERRSYENGALHGHSDESHHDDAGVLVNDHNVTEGSGKQQDSASPPEAAEISKENARDEAHHLPPTPPPLQSRQTEQLQLLPHTIGKPSKEKKKGIWSGLRRKTSILMNDA